MQTFFSFTTPARVVRGSQATETLYRKNKNWKKLERKNIDITILGQAEQKKHSRRRKFIYRFRLRVGISIENIGRSFVSYSIRTRVKKKKKIVNRYLNRVEREKNRLLSLFFRDALFINHRHRTDIWNKERWYRGTRYFFFLSKREKLQSRTRHASPPTTLARCSTLKQYLLICRYNEATL